MTSSWLSGVEDGEHRSDTPSERLVLRYAILATLLNKSEMREALHFPLLVAGFEAQHATRMATINFLV